MDKLIRVVGGVFGAAIVAVYSGVCYCGHQEEAMEIIVGAIVIFVFCVVFAIGCAVINDMDQGR